MARLRKRVTKTFNIPDDPDGAWIKIKFLKINEVKKIESQANDMYFQSDAKGEGNTRINFDPYTRSRLFAHACLLDWGGMNDTMGKAMKFSSVNIEKAAEFEVKVDDETFDFYGWVDKCRDELDVEVKAETEVAEEN